MTAQTFQPRRPREDLLAPPELAGFRASHPSHAELLQKPLGALDLRLVLIDHDRGRARLDPTVDQLLEISDRARMARFHPSDGVVCLRIVGIDRRGEANPVAGGIADRIIAQLRQIAEHLDELETDLLGAHQQFLKIARGCGSPPMNCSLRQPRS